MIKQELLEIIACPKCKGSVQLNKGKNTLICTACELAYTIRDSIPIMLIEEAKPLGQLV
ncbi:MAG: Trm112 family protein [Candidatus Electrothrix sp. AR3]|nr:Trm112 family protein [Candidatus Electrothrix sp. AR3]